MDTFLDMVTAVQSDLTVNSDSTFFDPNTVQIAVQRAHRKIVSMFKWPQTEDSQKTSTISGQEYYDYPTNWKMNSIWKLTVDGIDYGDPLSFKDYLYEQENQWPSQLKVAWGNQNRRYFIYPTPTTNGSFNIIIWGFLQPDDPTSNGDTTIFSGFMPEVNEAIVLEALAILKNKGEILQPVQRAFIGGTLLLNAEAQNIVAGAWKRIQDEKSKYEKTQPLFLVPDLFSSKPKVEDIIGNF